LAGWAIFLVSLIFVIYAAAHFSIKTYGEYEKVKGENDNLRKQKESLQVQQSQVESQSVARVNERTKHLNQMHEKGETVPVHTTGDGPAAVVTYFKSDGCIRLQRDAAASGPYGISSSQELWIPDPSHLPAAAPPSAVGTATQSNSSSKAVSRQEALGALPKPLFVSTGKLKKNARVIPAQAGCLNPHPWGFQGGWGAPNGCWIPFWRTWNDGCQHYQLYNSCTGQWYPQIYWTSCSAYHHP